MKPQRKASITGLLPATEYHIQVEGHNTAGYSAGDFYFFTLTKDGGKFHLSTMADYSLLYYLFASRNKIIILLKLATKCRRYSNQICM